MTALSARNSQLGATAPTQRLHSLRPRPLLHSSLRTSARDGVPASAPPRIQRSGQALLEGLRTEVTGATNVYGKPFSKSELAALQSVLSHLGGDPHGTAAATAGEEALAEHLMGLLLDAASAKLTPLPVVEGAMVVLELLARRAVGVALSSAADPQVVARNRWQLVVGADVGSVQYIPAVEELQVAPDGASFTLGTDLDFLFTGFSGPSQWLAPGHLSYTVRQVRIELRRPKAWRRAAAWLAWRRAGSEAGTGAAEPDWGDSLSTSQTCRDDPSAPATSLGLPFFPNNEIYAFRCDGRVAATRSRLGGLILLLEVATRERLRATAQRAVAGGHM